MGAARIRRVETRKEMEQIKDDFITQGYKIKSEGEKTVLMKQQKWGTGSGHTLVALLTVWWTLGLGNLIYAFVANSGSEEVLIKLEEAKS